LPAFGSDEKPLPATEREAMVDPDDAVAQRPAPSQERRDLERAECSLNVSFS
jgi:hypothetical protein